MFRTMLLPLALLLMIYPVNGQDTRKVPISFLPPPLETATYSLGIYDAKTGKLVRHLQESATTGAFTVGDNGLITSWDGNDDAGKPVPPGKYAARGYAVGALKVEGTDILGNDWTDSDEDLRVKHIEAVAFVPMDSGVLVLATLADGHPELLRFTGDAGKLLWRKPVAGLPPDGQPWLIVDATDVAVMPKRPRPDGVAVASVANYQVADGSASAANHSVSESETVFPVKKLPQGAIMKAEPPIGEVSTTLADPGLSIRSGIGALRPDAAGKRFAPSIQSEMQRSTGKDDTTWYAAELNGLVQTARDGTVLRRLDMIPGDPLPVAVSASTTADRLYLLEEKNGWQRVRGLSWVESKEEQGKPVSTWQTFFERNIRPPDTTPGGEGQDASIEIKLVENPLDPGKTQRIKLGASYDDQGSYLTANGLRLRRISQRANLKAARLAKGKETNSLAFFQNDGAAWDEFSIEGARNMMEFDAGEFEMTADGEKTHTEKAAEPPDL